MNKKRGKMTGGVLFDSGIDVVIDENDNGNTGIITQERIDENKKLGISCLMCNCIPKPDEWSGQVEGVCFDCG